MKKLLTLSLLIAAFPAFAQDIGALTEDTKKTVLPLIPKVVKAMEEAVADKGVAESIPVCKDEAPKLVKEMRERTGWSIRRVSLKTRNADRATPDAWETAVLADFDKRAAAGEAPQTMEKSELVSENGKSYLRYMKALPAAPICMNCHAATENLDPKLQAKLKEIYPQDKAVGYEPGQVRGALTVKRPL